MAKVEKDVCYQILSFELWRNLVVYNTRLLLTNKFILELFWRAIYSTIKGRIACWSKYCSWRLCRSQRKKIEIYEEINEGIIIEQGPEIKINVEEINENPSIHKDLEVEIVKTIKEEIIEEIVNDFDEIKLDDCNIQTPIVFNGKHWNKVYWFYWVGKIWFDHWLLCAPKVGWMGWASLGLTIYL